MNKAFLFTFVSVWLSACVYTEKLKDGATAFELKHYAVASELLKKEYSTNKSRLDKGKTAFLIGECFQHMNAPEKSLEWYKIAFDSQYKGAAEQYAFALKETEDYSEAIVIFEEAGREAGDFYEFRKQIKSCRNALKWKGLAEKAPFKLENLALNSPVADYSPTPYKDNMLIFSSDKNTATGDDLYGWTKKSYSDLFLSNPEKTTSDLFEGPFNTNYNEGTLSFNSDFTEVFFTRCGVEAYGTGIDYCKIYYSKLEDNKWTSPEVLNLGNSNFNYMHPHVYGKGIIFATNNDDGFGGYDLYAAFRNNLDEWDPPRNLGSSVNTEKNELFPFADVDSLYFSSDGHLGMGGLDIFKAVKREGRWTNTTNLKAPVNSGGDDFGYILVLEDNLPDTVLQTGYLSSNRTGGQGGDDIYKFAKVLLPPPPVVVIDSPKIEFSITLLGSTKEKVFEIPENPNSKTIGFAALPGVEVEILFGEDVEYIRSDDDGKFSFPLAFDTDYQLTAKKPGYFTQKKSITTKNLQRDEANPDQTIEVEFLLEKIFEEKEITLDNIYYDFDQDKIREDAEPTLINLANILASNPSIKIQLSSHTDCQGAPGYNRDLSQRRAQSAVNYLIEKGVQAERLVAKGYGEDELIETCQCANCTEEEHQRNRRTTFKVLK